MGIKNNIIEEGWYGGARSDFSMSFSSYRVVWMQFNYILKTAGACTWTCVPPHTQRQLLAYPPSNNILLRKTAAYPPPAKLLVTFTYNQHLPSLQPLHSNYWQKDNEKSVATIQPSSIISCDAANCIQQAFPPPQLLVTHCLHSCRPLISSWWRGYTNWSSAAYPPYHPA